KNPSPYLRGLAADRRGGGYAAAPRCPCVVRGTPPGKGETGVKGERARSAPRGARFGGGVDVVEGPTPNGGAGGGREPRRRKRGRDGKVTTLATIPKEERKEGP